MNKQHFAGEYVRWHVLTEVFSGYENWQNIMSLLGAGIELEEQDYEDYFYGTNAAIYVPLWASVCQGREPVLMNRETLEVIRFYKRLGYRTVDIESNPPDYIGQQCRFMEYLSVLILKGDKELEAEYERFLVRFVENTFYEIEKAVNEGNPPEGIQWICELLREAVCRESWSGADVKWEKFDSYAWTRGEAEELEAPYETPQASFYDCGRKCKMKAVVQEGCVLSIGPDLEYGKKEFVGCIRGYQYRQTFLTPHRLRYPMIRRGKRGEGLFKRITWEEASDIVAAKIRQTMEEYGPQSRYVMPASGVCGAIRGDRFAKELLVLTGGFLDYYNYYSAACAEHILPYIYGTEACGSAEEEMLKSRLLILWGNNPADTIWGPDFLKNMAEAKRRGVRIIVIDPRQSDTAVQYADQWIGIQPSTDGALADALAYEIWSRGLQDQEFMDRFCIGFDEEHMPENVPKEENYRAYLFGEKDGIVKDAVWGENITGVSAEVIVKLATELAGTKPAWILPGLGPQRTLNGEQTCRSFIMLACLTGNVGIPGGGSGGFLMRKGESAPEYTYRTNPYPGKIPSFLWVKAVDRWNEFTEGDGLTGTDRLDTGVKLLFNLASGLLINQHSNINDTIRVLGEEDRLETVVVSELFMTPGARYADLLLPGASFLETENIVLPWLPADYFLYNTAAITPLFEGRFEYEWLREAAAKLGVEKEFSQGRTAAGWLKALYEKNQSANEEAHLPDYEAFKKEGCYVYRSLEEKTAFGEQIEKGVPFQTPSGKIEIFSKRLYERGQRELPGIPCYTPCEEGAEDPLRERFPLQLIGYHTKRRCHSTNDHNRNLDRIDKPHLWIHPEDASKRGLENGALAEIYNDRGRVRVPVKVTERIVRGVVALSEGGWYTPDENGVDVRGSINVLTMTHRATPLAKANPQHTNLVEVKRCEEYV
ncbi:DMSO/selenate family reductase complex A subunit [Roseburia hominis]